MLPFYSRPLGPLPQIPACAPASWCRFLRAIRHSQAISTLRHLPPGSCSYLRLSPVRAALRSRAGPFLGAGPRGWRLHGSRRSFTPSSFRRKGPDPTTGPRPAKPQSLSARLKKLSKEYGWAALGVYMTLSFLDFPLCFLVVRMAGTEKISSIEQYLTSTVGSIVPQQAADRWHQVVSWLSVPFYRAQQRLGFESKLDVSDPDCEEGQETSAEGPGLATQLALAYAVHKSFIFLRLPLTAAILPKVVKVLRSFGWNIGKKRPRP